MNLLIFKPYKSSNGHTVKSFGRLLFHVTSASRKDVVHTVDLEMQKSGEPIKDVEYASCDCEDAHYRHARPCRHVLAVFEALEDSIMRQTKNVRIEHEKAQRRIYKLDKSKRLK